MKISAVSNSINVVRNRNIRNLKQNNNTLNKKTSASFKGIYIEDNVNLGLGGKRNIPPTFELKDALMLDKVAKEYSNQDCFIKGGNKGYPYLEYREKPPEVQVFNHTLSDVFRIDIDHRPSEYPFQPMLLKKDSGYAKFIGLPTYKTDAPSLPYTVKAGFELHKNIMDKKYKVLELIGDNDGYDIGKESIESRSYADVTDMESSLLRLLIELAYDNLQPEKVFKKDYAHNYVLDLEKLNNARIYDLSTTYSARPPEEKEVPKSVQKFPDDEDEEIYKPKEPENTSIDICDIAEKYYPNIEENAIVVQALVEDMDKKNMSLE